MARTPLVRGLQDAAEAAARTISIEQVLEERRTSRRRFLAEAGALGLAAAITGKLAAPARGAGAPRIAVVGAGLAGLTCAYRLRQASRSGRSSTRTSRPRATRRRGTRPRRAGELDAMSIVDWIEESVPSGMSTRLGQLLDVAYNIEYGAESSEQSSLNLLYLLGYSGQGQLRIFGPSNEKYHVHGGNDQIPAGLAERLPGQIATGTELVAVKLNSGGTYTLTLRKGSGTTSVTADHVVLALPFSILRRSVDLSKAGFEPRKLTAINEQGMGTNSKLHVQFASRHWNDLGSNGETFSDRGYQNTWEVTRGQAGASGILVDYTGGTIGASFGSGTPAQRAQQFLVQLEPVLPGITRNWNGRATIDYWPGYRWTRGSYSYWKPGQYTKFAGFERERQGNCHFAGEHCSSRAT